MGKCCGPRVFLRIRRAVLCVLASTDQSRHFRPSRTLLVRAARWSRTIEIGGALRPRDLPAIVGPAHDTGMVPRLPAPARQSRQKRTQRWIKTRGNVKCAKVSRTANGWFPPELAAQSYALFSRCRQGYFPDKPQIERSILLRIIDETSGAERSPAQGPWQRLHFLSVPISQENKPDVVWKACHWRVAGSDFSNQQVVGA